MMPSDGKELSKSSKEVDVRRAVFNSSMTIAETDREKGVFHKAYGKKEANASYSNSRSSSNDAASDTNTRPTGPGAAGGADHGELYSSSSNLMSAIEATNNDTACKRKRKEDNESSDDAAVAAANAKAKNRRSSAKESRDRRKQLFEDLQMSVARLAQENRELKRNNETVMTENNFLKSQLLGLLKGGSAGPSASVAAPATAPPSTTSVASAAVTALFQNQEQQQLQSLLRQLSRPAPTLSSSTAVAVAGATSSINPNLGLQSTLQQRLALLQAAQSSPSQSSPLHLGLPRQIQVGQQLMQTTPIAASSNPAIVSQEGLSRLDQNSNSQLLIQLISSLSGGSNSQDHQLQDLNDDRFGGI